MSEALDRARQQVLDANYRGAVKSLWIVRDGAASDRGEAQGLLEVSTDLQQRSVPRSVMRDAESMAEFARQCLADEAIAVVHRCVVLGGAGLDLLHGSTCDLIFRPEHLLVRQTDGDAQSLTISWDELDLVVAGAGEIRHGGRFFGGGFGAVGAAEGMLIAAALNKLTTRTTIDTVVRLQTPTAEIFFHHDEVPPAQLRMQLSAVFTKLRSVPARSVTGPDNVVEKLEKLAALLDRGLLTDDEFARLKAELLG